MDSAIVGNDVAAAPARRRKPRRLRRCRWRGTVTNVGLFGQLPELFVELSNGHRVLSFMTSEGNPEWALFDRRSAKSTWLCIRQGLLVEEVSAAGAVYPPAPPLEITLRSACWPPSTA